MGCKHIFHTIEDESEKSQVSVGWDHRLRICLLVVEPLEDEWDDVQWVLQVLIRQGTVLSSVKVHNEALVFPETLEEGLKVNEEAVDVAIGRGEILVNNEVKVNEPVVVLEPFIASEVVVIRRFPLTIHDFIVPRFQNSDIRQELMMSAVPFKPSQAVYAIVLEALTKHGSKVTLRRLNAEPMIMQALNLGPLIGLLLRIDGELVDFFHFLIIVLMLALLNLNVHCRVESVLLRNPWHIRRDLNLLIELQWDAL